MVNEILLKRKSIKTFLPGNIDDEKIEALFKAASMAPSSMNEQPWSFIIAKKEDEDNFNKLLNLMSQKNQIWAKDSSILVVAIAKRNFSLNNKVNKHYIYDVSSAVANLTYQALSIGLYVHQVGGFDVERSRKELNISDQYDPVVMLSIGYNAGDDNIINTKPRKNLKEFVFEKQFGNPANFRSEV